MLSNRPSERLTFSDGLFNIQYMSNYSYIEMHRDLDEETLFQLSQIFKALGDPTRIRILNLLCSGEYAVGEIAEKLDLSQSATSHQLRFLKNLRLVKFRREGTKLFYSEDDAHVIGLLKQALNHISHH